MSSIEFEVSYLNWRQGSKNSQFSQNSHKKLKIYKYISGI